MFLMLVISRLSIVRIDVGRVEDGQRRVVEERRAVDDDEVVGQAQRLDDPLDPGRGDELGHLRRRRGEQDADAGGVVDDERVDRLDVVRRPARAPERGRRSTCSCGFRLSRTPTSPNWNEPSTTTTCLPSSVAAATARLTATVVRPTPPLGLNTATTMPGSPRSSPAAAPAPAARGGRDRRRGRHPAGLVALAGVDLSDRGGQLVAAERLDQELARAGQHRAAEVVRLALDRHHHDRRGRGGPSQLLGRGDAVHVRHVDVHQDDIRGEACRHARWPQRRTPRSRPRRCRSRSRAAS